MKFTVINTYYGSGYKVNQDIAFHDGKLYIMETKPDIKHSGVLIVNVGTIKSNKTYKPMGIWTTSNTQKWEVETMCVLKDGRILFGMNTNDDGVYLVKDAVLTKQPAPAKKKYSGTITLPKRGYFKKGDDLNEVKDLKKFLNWYGHYGLDENNKKYLDKMVASVKDFQEKEGLKVDGEFGKNCLEKAKKVER